jgi:fructose-1,6-bisphosphatase/inositol monophosphatase family enzyme
VSDDDILAVLTDAAGAVHRALAALDDWGPAGTKPGQYRLDLAADGAALEVLHAAGLAVLSEESGLTRPEGAPPADLTDLLVVLDPVDGSTNAHRGLPIYSTSICVLDEGGPRVGLVINQASLTRYDAVRGAGARRNGEAIAASGCKDLSEAVVGIGGFPRTRPRWAQFRALGSAALELCAVAEGALDAYTVAGGGHLFPWDYLAGVLICTEAGAVVAEIDGADLVARDGARRRPAAAATPELLDQVLATGI